VFTCKDEPVVPKMFSVFVNVTVSVLFWLMSASRNVSDANPAVPTEKAFAKNPENI